jgi:hypothetical protein
LKRAVFRLERNAVLSRMISSLLKAFLCLLGAGAVFAVSNMASEPNANSLLATATGTPSGIVIPTSMPTAVITSGQALAGMSVTPTVILFDAAGNTVTPGAPQQPAELAATVPAPDGAVTATPTLAPTDLPPLEPTPSPIPPTTAPELMADCANPSAQITNPGPNEQVVGAYTVRGTAVLETGGWYQIEILLPGTGRWDVVGRGASTVTGGVLFENFNAASFLPGDYPFRLVLMGPDGGIRAFCRIPIKIGS